MLNRPLSPLGNDNDSAGMKWNADRNPQLRLSLLWVAALLPILAISGRVAQLQLGLRDKFTATFLQTTESIEVIPARDGRIFAADGSVLADDVEEYDIAVEYPAIKEPPDDEWLAEIARPRMSSSDRKDPTKRAAEKEKVVAERDAFWKRLAELTNRSLSDVTENRRREQVRVERIKASVLRRRRDRQEAETSGQRLSEETPQSTLQASWERFVKLVGEAPDRDRGHLQIPEESGYHSVISGIDINAREEIEAHPQKYPYAKIVVRKRRTYPQKEMASHLIGIRKPLTDEQYRVRQAAYPDGDPQDYRIGDPYGVSGLEHSYDELLKGVRGLRVLVKNRRGEIVETITKRETKNGRDLALTLNPELQHRMEQLLAQALTKVTARNTVDSETHQGVYLEPTVARGGSIVVLDIYSGAILAAASAPSFDLNLLLSSDPAAWEDIMSDSRSPLFSRATKMALPPGSVFKIITAVASIESRKMHPSEILHCQGYLDHPGSHRCLVYRHNHVGHYDVTLTDALCRSCNVYFYTAARRMGPETLVDWARRFGIGQPTGIDLPSESSGHLPDPNAPVEPGQKKTRWKPSNTLDMAIGQDQLMVTPMQMARVVAAIANDGNLVTPHLAANLGPATIDESDSDSNLFPQFSPRPIEGLHSETLDYVREGLTQVVNKPGGTGYKKIRMEEIKIAGKTGTAETGPHGSDHAWFAGYVPAEQPRIVFVVVLENGGGGGSAAGPVAHDLVEALLEVDLISRPSVPANRRITKK